MNEFLTVTAPDWIRENIVFKFKDPYNHRPTTLTKILLWVFGISIILYSGSQAYLHYNNFDRMVVVDVYSRADTFVLDAAEDACGVNLTPGQGRGSFEGELYAWSLETIDGDDHIFNQYQRVEVSIEGNQEMVTMYAGPTVTMDPNDIPKGEIRDAVYARALKEVKALNYIVVFNPQPDESKLHTPVQVRCVRYATIWSIWN